MKNYSLPFVEEMNEGGWALIWHMDKVSKYNSSQG